MAHGVVRTDNLAGTDVRSELISVRYQPSGTKTEIDNGNVVLLNGLETGSRTVYKGATPAANSNIGDIVLIASPEVMYDERIRNLDQYYNVAGKISRGYRLHSNDIFSVTKDALDGATTPVVGDVVELKAGTKLNVVAAATGATEGSTVVGKIEDINVVGRYTYYAIKVNDTTGTVTLTTGVSSLADLDDVDLTTDATNGQVLKYDSTAGKWSAADDATE